MIAEQGRVPNKYSETVVYLDRGEAHDFSGYLEHPAQQGVWRFDDVVTLIALHERIFSEADYPQPTYELRKLKETQNREKEWSDLDSKMVNKDEVLRDEKPTFIINVQYRQNASWQGTVRWVEGDVEKRFRSMLELIKLMDSVVESGGEAFGED